MMLRSALRVVLVTTTLLIGALALSSAASAGTYDVWTCHAPDGSPAAVHDRDGGWRFEEISTNLQGGNLMVSDCPTGGALRAALGTSMAQPAPSWLLWKFVAPDATSIEHFVLDFDGYTRPFNGPWHGGLGFSTSRQRDPEYLFLAFPAGGDGRLARRTISGTGGSAAHLLGFVTCAPRDTSVVSCEPGPDGAPARLNIYRATFTLQDREAPTVTSVSGDAVTEATWVGSTGISVAAADQGGGVYRLGVEVDGQMRSWTNLAGAPCVSWTGMERTFVSPKPCPATVGGVQTISTADLPEGPHSVRVVVEDAAGNQTTAYGPTTKTLQRSPVAAAGPLGVGALAPGQDLGPENGTPAATDARLRARWAGGERDVKTIRHNQRPTLDGQLTTASGQPIRDALIRVTITRDARRSPSFERDSLKTDREGRFRWKQPAGVSSRSIRLAYHRRLRDSAPVATRTLRLKVKAPIRLRLSRTLARRGDTVRLAGSLVGRPLPAMGKVIELQARNPGGRWITFRTVRTRRNGQFTARYRFRNPGPARFQMRVRSRRSGDYPYATGVSPIRAIAVR